MKQKRDYLLFNQLKNQALKYFWSRDELRHILFETLEKQLVMSLLNFKNLTSSDILIVRFLRPHRLSISETPKKYISILFITCKAFLAQWKVLKFN